MALYSFEAVCLLTQGKWWAWTQHNVMFLKSTNHLLRDGLRKRIPTMKTYSSSVICANGQEENSDGIQTQKWVNHILRKLLLSNSLSVLQILDLRRPEFRTRGDFPHLTLVNHFFFFNWRNIALHCCVGSVIQQRKSALIIHITASSCASLPSPIPLLQVTL